VPTRFLIWTTQRTGSTVFWRTLDRHPEVEAHGEMFLPEMKREDSHASFLARSPWARLEQRVAPGRSMARYLAQLYAGGPGVRAVGFKLMYNHITPPLERWIAREKPLVVHLVRRNLLKLLVSRVSAEQRGLYHLEPGEAPPADRVKLDPGVLVTRMEKITAELERGAALATARCALEVAYEDLLADRTATYARVFEFLGVSPAPVPEEPLRKINPDALPELVENWEAVVIALRGTPFEEHLTD
jgi:LPS sulfotransferase NodH